MSNVVRESRACRWLLLSVSLAALLCATACSGKRRQTMSGGVAGIGGVAGGAAGIGGGAGDAGASGSPPPPVCDDGFDDCDGDADNGCETFLGTVEHCGACDTACDFGMACLAGVCRGAFSYTPSNFDPTGISSGPPVTLDCGVSTFDSTTLTFDNWCDGPTPTPVTRPQTDGPDLVLLPLAAFTLASGATLQLTGDLPVVLVVFGDATVDGTLDASATGVTPGAGGNWSCGDSAGSNGTFSTNEGRGGGGGGFAGVGGPGGRYSSSSAGGPGGVARGVATMQPLYGGCEGGNGGGCTNGSAGGGAIQMSVGGTLTVTGTVRANGAPGGNDCGGQTAGGGGGSGGGILLEADSLVVSGATLEANGGRGGNGNGGDGGNGSSNMSSPDGTQGEQSNDGAGGGGGAYGRAFIRGITNCTHALQNVTLDGACNPPAP